MSDSKYDDIRSMPNSDKFRENFERIMRNKDREFCEHCGAGVGEHFREGEGTCEKCDPGGERGFNGRVSTT